MNPSRPLGRHKQMNKRIRLRRRELGQWKPQVQITKQRPEFGRLGDYEWGAE